MLYSEYELVRVPLACLKLAKLFVVQLFSCPRVIPKSSIITSEKRYYEEYVIVMQLEYMLHHIHELHKINSELE